MFKFKELFSFISKDLFFRFPVVFVFMFLAFLFGVFENHHFFIFEKQLQLKILFGSISLAIFSTALYLFFEAKRLSFFIKFLLFLVLFFINYLALFIYFDSFVFLFALAVVLFSFSNFLFKKSSNSSMVYFNLQTIYVIVFAFISSLILGLVSNMILVSLDYLFSLSFLNKNKADVFIFIAVIIFPTLVLSNIKKRENSINIELKQPLKVLVKNIFTPFVVIYAVILYAYFIKIVFIQELPKGDLAWMATVFLSVVIVLKILYSCLNEHNFLTSFVDRYYIYLMIVPLVFLYLSVYVRVEQYGITQSRYALILIAFWFTYIVCYHLIKREFNVKNSFVIMSLFLLLASVTPFSASNISYYSQIDRLKSFFVEHNMIKDEKIVPIGKDISIKQRAKISSILYYLSREKEGQKRVNELLNKEFKNSSEVLKYLNIKYASTYDAQAPKRYIEGFDVQHIIFDTKDYRYLFPFNIGIGKAKYSSSKNSLDIKLKNSILTVEFENKSIRFDLKALVEKWQKEKISLIDKNNYKKASIISNGVQLQIKYMDIRNEKERPKILFVDGLIFFN